MTPKDSETKKAVINIRFSTDLGHGLSFRVLLIIVVSSFFGSSGEASDAADADFTEAVELAFESSLSAAIAEVVRLGLSDGVYRQV